MTVNMVYASSKPIELTTLASSIGVLSQKIWYVWYKVQWIEDLYLQKHEYISQGEELWLSINHQCLWEEDKKLFRDVLDELYTLDLVTVPDRIFYIANVFADTKEKLDVQCTMN
jgi:hypothetical protein